MAESAPTFESNRTAEQIVSDTMVEFMKENGGENFFRPDVIEKLKASLTKIRV